MNDHLLALERSVVQDKPDKERLAKTMMVFMVRGLFTPLRFPYAQFPCGSVTGDLLFYPFWQAVYILERMGLKVCVYNNKYCNAVCIDSFSSCFIRSWVLPLMVLQ